MISISPQAATVKKGETVQLTVTKDFDGDVKYLTTNKNVATVDETGLVTAQGVSSTYITAVAKGPKGLESATTRIDVPGLMMVPNPELERDVKVNKVIIFSILKKHPANYEVVAKVDNEDLAKIKQVGSSSYQLHAIAQGTVSVMFALIDPNIEVEDETDTSNVIDMVTYTVTIGTINDLVFDNAVTTCELGEEEVEIPVTVDPEGTEYRMISSNEKVFKVTEGNKGVPTGLGSAILTVKKYDLSDQCTVKVEGLDVKVRGTLSTGHCIFLDTECTEKCAPKFESSDNTIATVTKKGVVTGVKSGDVEITVTVGKYSKVISLTCVEFFSPIEDLTDEDKKNIKIFCNNAEMRAYAKGRPIINGTILDGVIPISYIKNNCDPNVFEYELAILDKDLTRYNSLKLADIVNDLAMDKAEVTMSIPENLVTGTETTIPVTLKSKDGVEKVRVHFKINGPGTATCKMTDSAGTEFSFDNEGYWGPEEGFDMPAGYEATTDCKVTVDKAGTYNFEIEVVKVEDSSVVNSFSSSIDAIAKVEEAEITVQQPDNLVVGQDAIVPVTLTSSTGAEKVVVRFSTEGPGKATYKMTDSLGQEFTFENSGEWGPAEGFDMNEGYSATTNCTINVDTSGTYQFTINIVKAETDEVLASASYTVDAVGE